MHEQVATVCDRGNRCRKDSPAFKLRLACLPLGMAGDLSALNMQLALRPMRAGARGEGSKKVGLAGWVEQQHQPATQQVQPQSRQLQQRQQQQELVMVVAVAVVVAAMAVAVAIAVAVTVAQQQRQQPRKES